MSNLRQDTLFLACTRPAMALGLPQDALAVVVITCGEVTQWLLHFHHIFIAVLFDGAIYGACVALAAYDPHIFRSLFTWMRTCLQASIASDIWGGASVSPAPARARRPKDIVVHA